MEFVYIIIHFITVVDIGDIMSSSGSCMWSKMGDTRLNVRGQEVG